ncbi:MAG: hypothetical protein U9Q82_13490 [Chloroflexota bacterium]|nr:hypothetical protein [Chloroflexota bacterium]
MLVLFHRSQHWLILLVVAVLIVGCNPASQQQTFTPPAPTDTDVPVSATATSPPPTDTPVPPTDTPTPSPSPTEPPTHTPTPTKEPAALEANQDAVCRIGPGLAFSIRKYLVAGEEAADVSGVVDADPKWWLITLASDDDVSCWIADQAVTVSGNVSALPILTPPPLPTASPVPTLVGGGLYYFLIAENTGGPFGCGDGIVRVYPGIPRTGNFSQDVAAALNALFSNHQKYFNGFYNPMYASSLRVGDVDRPSSSGGDTNIHLSGDLVRPKDKCESQRMHDQVWQTIYQQFSESGHAVIRVNRGLLGDLLVIGK